MGGMPLAAIITIAVIAGVIVLIVAVTFALRARRHKRLSQQLVKRDDDQVHYVFVVNPSKPRPPSGARTSNSSAVTRD